MSILSFYRTKTAIQVKFIPPVMVTKNNTTYTEQTGALLFEAATGENRSYDWSKKVVFGVGIADVPLLLGAFQEYKRTGTVKVDIVHDPNMGKEEQGQIIKTLSFANGRADSKGKPTFYLTLNSTSNGQTNKVFVGLSEGELELLIGIINQISIYLLGWNNVNRTGEAA